MTDQARIINMSKERVTRNEIMAIPAPEYTKTWHPVPHKMVIEALDTVIESQGIGLISETYSVKNQGRNVFGTWTLDIGLDGLDGPGSKVQIGFRNSLMKTFAVGICSGTFVMVCSNMCFSGEFIEFRKHTSGLDFDELLVTANQAFAGVMDRSRKLHAWQEDLHHTPLPQPDFKQLTFDAMQSGILAPNRFRAFLDAHEAEVAQADDERSLYQFHGAVTRMSRDHNLFTVSDRTRDLATLLDDYREAA